MWCLRAIGANACRLAIHDHTRYASLTDADAFPVEINPADLVAFEALFDVNSASQLVGETDDEIDAALDENFGDDQSDNSDDDQDDGRNGDYYGPPSTGLDTSIPTTINHDVKVAVRSALGRLSEQIEVPRHPNPSLVGNQVNATGPRGAHQYVQIYYIAARKQLTQP